MELNSRIVGGTVMIKGQLPYQGSLQVCRSINIYTERCGHICGASLLGSKWGLTAAHCIDRVVPTSLRIRFGSLAMFEGGILCEIINSEVHPQYDRYYYDYDYGLVELKQRISPTAYIKPINLPRENYEVAAGTMCTVGGWGYTLNSSQSASILRGVNVRAFSLQDCVNFYKDEFVSNRMMCAGYVEGGKDCK